MARVVVDTAKLTQVANELRSLNNQLKNEASTMRSNQQSLNAQWDGPSHDNFNQAFTRNVGEFEAFSRLIDEYANKLDSFVRDYVSTENRNKEIARTR